MERRLGRFVNVRTNYQHTTSGGGILLTEQQHEGRNVHALGAGGRSTYRQFEATARLSWERGQQMLFSYVRSKALGDLNTFTAYLGDFPTAPLRPNHYTNTRGDIPHRFIAWGIVNLPWNTRLAPIFQPSRRSCEYGRSSVGSFLRPFQTALPRGFRNPVLGSSAISSTLSDFAYFVGNGVDRDQYQLGFLGFGGQTGIAGTKPSRLGIRTFGKLCASMMSVS